MTPTERDQVLFRINAAWRAMPDATLSVWSEHLAAMDYVLAVKAVQSLERTKVHPPSLAELHEAVRAATPSTPMPALEGPHDASGAARAAELVGQLTARSPITATELDKAGVARWRERLRDAIADDADRGTHRANYDLAWHQIRTEYREANT